MPVYISLLRGINVGGHKLVAMAKLRASFAALGFEQVETYIQSGNVVYRTKKTSTAKLSSVIERKLVEDFGFEVLVITRTREELEKAITGNPFVKEKGIDPEKLHVSFLYEAPAPEALQVLASLTKTPDRSEVVGAELYLYLPNGMAKSSLANNAIERKHLKRSTVRNWRTVHALYQMALECK